MIFHLRRRLAHATLAILVVVASWSNAKGSSCDIYEVTPRDGENGKQVYEDIRSPWHVTIDLSDGRIDIKSAANQCTITLQDISGVYIGMGDRIVFRTAEVASEQLFTIDASTCRDVAKPINVDTANAAAFRKTLATHKICPR